MSDEIGVTVYGDDRCAYCAAARMLLTRKGVRFEDVVVSREPDRLAEMEARSGRRSVPQIFVGDHHIGGFDELCSLDKSGELDKLLADLKGGDNFI
jgi:glutaredoxin 3